MKFNDDKEDFFDQEIVKPEKPVKQPELKPEDPDYWEQPESEFEHLIPIDMPKRYLWKWYLAGALVVIGVVIFAYFRYFSPYIDQTVQYGYVDNIERRGILFKTYEGVLIPYKEITDTTRVYREDWVFTADPKVAADLKRMQYANKPVRVEYKKYHTTLPWRGESKILVIKVDSVSPSQILPPEFLHDTTTPNERKSTIPSPDKNE